MPTDRELLELTPEQQGRLARAVMRRQGRLSLGVAAIFLGLLMALPLVNALHPDAAATPVGGIPANWAFLGIAFYPIAVALSVAFVRRSDAIEAACTDWRGLLADGEARP